MSHPFSISMPYVIVPPWQWISLFNRNPSLPVDPQVGYSTRLTTLLLRRQPFMVSRQLKGAAQRAIYPSTASIGWRSVLTLKGTFRGMAHRKRPSHSYRILLNSANQQERWRYLQQTPNQRSRTKGATQGNRFAQSNRYVEMHINIM